MNRCPKKTGKKSKNSANANKNLLASFGKLLLMEEILHQLIDSLSHYLQDFINPRWCRISSINSIMASTWKNLKIDRLNFPLKNSFDLAEERSQVKKEILLQQLLQQTPRSRKLDLMLSTIELDITSEFLLESMLLSTKNPSSRVLAAIADPMTHQVQH